jgi:hypothetical protein
MEERPLRTWKACAKVARMVGGMDLWKPLDALATVEMDVASRLPNA